MKTMADLLAEVLEQLAVKQALANILQPAVRQELVRQQAQQHPLAARECARLYCGGDDGAALSRRRTLRADYPVIDEAALNPGAGRMLRWDAAKLAEIMAELGPSLRVSRRRYIKPNASVQ